ncbi:MAG: hypothetical protein A2148_11745 [Chloroflexi bacterium RBG_16_68_14]|nr:MAG: hypothetical protein A2148_11745 [Chloroflexi bacterium RBG_16_68_14]
MHVTEQTVSEGADHLMTVRHLTIRGTNFEIGRRVGELAIERFGHSPAHFAANPLYARARRQYVQRDYPIQWERVRGAASAFGLDPEDDRYDLTGIMYNVDLPPAMPGCSVVSYPPSTTSTGRGYVSRNYDFSTGSLADLFPMPLPPEAKAQMGPLMREPYIMEWYPEDGGYASLAIHSFDLLSGTLDGINSEGLVVTIMADGEAIIELGPRLELHLGQRQVVGLHELQVMRLLLDTCATADEAKQALLLVKQHYTIAPCHYLIADEAGHSFIYENSTGRNAQHIIEGTGAPLVCTNYQIHRHPTPEPMLAGGLTPVNEWAWRYRTVTERVAAHRGLFTADEIKEINACVNYQRVMDAMSADHPEVDVAASITARTMWHSLYDQQSGTVEFSFYLGEDVRADGTRGERRGDYLKFALESSKVAGG